MTGTAATEAAEFYDIYKMNVVTIPTNMPVRRADDEDEFYKNQDDKFAAIVKAIREKQETGQPILVGTVSIEKSELLSEYLKKAKVKHEVLNARYHEQEAHIVAQAGRLGAVTIATNMAGRGTDIQLGGNVEFRIDDELARRWSRGPRATRRSRRSAREVAEEKERVIAAGGLFVLGTERHESRRIDNQLRGRSGRQGDPGLSPLLSQPRRRSAAHLRPADDVRAPDEQESRRRRGDHLALDLQGDRDRAEEGRGAQLRHPQAGRRI